MNWDLSVLYQGFDDPAFARDLESIGTLTQQLDALTAGDLPPATRLEQAAALSEELSALLDKVGNYAYLSQAADAGNAAAAQAVDKFMHAQIGVKLAHSKLIRDIGGMENLEEIIANSERLQSCAFALREMREQAAHLLPADLEAWMLRMSLSGGDAFSQLRDKLDATHVVSYRGEELPLAAVRAKAYDPDPSVRKDAYEAELASYAKMEIPMSYCLNSIKAQGQTMAEAKGYESVLDWMLDASRMDRQTLDAMWTAVREYLPAFRRYLRAKGRLLGHADGLPFYDLFAPVGKVQRTYTVEEARRTLVREMGKFMPEMGSFIDNAFENSWIDMFPREGKGGGAFCSGVHCMDISRILTNFAGSFSDVSTLAHELGHAWHDHCLAGLPYSMIDVPMPLAETASTFNETVLSHQVLSAATGDEAFALLEAGLMEETQTVVDIYSRFLFESEVIETRKDHTMSVEELKDAMLRAQEASYGDGLAKDVRHPDMWACKCHYYSPDLHFYNFPYCFGTLFGKGVFAQYLEKGPSFGQEYNRLLRSCGSAAIADVAASVGIDVHSVDFWRSSLEVIAKDIERFVEMVEKR